MALPSGAKCNQFFVCERFLIRTQTQVIFGPAEQRQKVNIQSMIGVGYTSIARTRAPKVIDFFAACCSICASVHFNCGRLLLLTILAQSTICMRWAVSVILVVITNLSRSTGSSHC